MHERLQVLLKEYSLTSAKFADILGIQPSAISHLLSGRNKPSFDLLSKVLSNFPELNPRWLILGESPMYGDTPENIASTASKAPASDLLTLDDSGLTEKNEVPTQPFNFEFSHRQGEKSTEFPNGTSSDDEKITDQSALREIKSVIIFYSDGTFESFKP